MNKIKIIIDKRKVEIWEFLKVINSILRISAYGMLLLSTWFSLIISWGMINNPYKVVKMFNEEFRYLEVLGNLIYIPLKFCLSFWLIRIFFQLIMRLVESEMNEEEKIKVGIKSSIIKSWNVAGGRILKGGETVGGNEG